MILYFSGTGNSRWVAREIALATGDRALDIMEAEFTPNLDVEERIGIVFPVYAWGIPEPMIEFLDAVRMPDGAFLYGVCTYGAEAGLSMRDLARIVPLDSSYGIEMPNSYIASSGFEPPSMIRKKVENARKAVALISSEVLERRSTSRVNPGSFPFFKSRIANKGFNRFSRSTEPFRASEGCVSCGLCARRCPSRCIEMDGRRPIWKNAECFHCFRCVNSCPQAAIEYGKATEGKARYSIERVLETEKEGFPEILD